MSDLFLFDTCAGDPKVNGSEENAHEQAVRLWPGQGWPAKRRQGEPTAQTTARWGPPAEKCGILADTPFDKFIDADEE